MKILFFANTDWYLYNFRLAFARFLRERGHEVVMVSPPGPHGERIRAEGFRWRPVIMRRRSLNPLGEMDLLENLVRIYRAERPDLAHHFTIKCVVYGTLAARLSGTRAAVNAVAGLGYVFVSESRKARWLRPAVRGMLKWSCSPGWVRVVLQNRDDLALFERLGVSRRDNLSLIRGSGVDVSRFAPGGPPVGRSPVVVLFVGRLLYDKGIAEFVECARRVRRDAPVPIRFVVAGEADPGNPASVDVATLARWRAAGDVEFVGHVVDMPALVAGCDIVALPSYGEGAPRSLIEAAACEKPLVASDVQGCREVVLHGVNGLLVPPRDPVALGDALLYLVGDAPLRARMGRAGRAHVLDALDERIVFRDTYAVYGELLRQAAA